MADASEATKAPVALFAGAHPDDIEIGAGGTVARLAAAGWKVWMLILTSEADKAVAATRATEATSAGMRLGVSPDCIVLAHFTDSQLVCDGMSVEHVRRLLHDYAIQPDVVFTHTHADSHKDHRETSEIVSAVFRRKPIAGFGIVNSLTRSRSGTSAFEPRLYVDISATYDLKLEALSEHVSQHRRIYEDRIADLCSEFGSTIGSEYAEAFDLIIQDGAPPECIARIAALNDSPFHRFWSTILDGRNLVIIHAAPVWRSRLDGNWASDKDREGISLVYRAFREMWEGRAPVEDMSCKTPGIEGYTAVYDVLLSGGAVSNSVTREYFNHFPSIRYAIDYSMPNYTDIRIRDRLRDESLYASYESDGRLRLRGLVRDTGILTIMPSPLRAGRVVLGCMGIHGHGTLACFRYLTEPLLLHELSTVISLPLDKYGIQLLVDYDVKNDRPSIRSDSVHVFEVKTGIE